MGRSRGDELTDHHNRGEQDHAEGKSYSPPHGMVDKFDAWLKDTLGGTKDSEEKVIEDNNAYGQGWGNVKK